MDLIKFNKIIDYYYQGKIEIDNLPRGCGRVVLSCDKYVFKFPHLISSNMCGIKQNEYELYFTSTINDNSDLHSFKGIFNEVLYSYKGVNVYKKLLTDTEDICEVLGLKDRLELEVYINREFKRTLMSLVSRTDLQLDDALHVDNWGYDLTYNCLKCLDYGAYEDSYEEDNSVACVDCTKVCEHSII